MAIAHQNDTVIVSVEMFFQGRTWNPGQPGSNDVTVLGNIEWQLKRDPADGKLKGFRYTVTL